tara:strand:+ start:181 stop:480 length:300 start_codon:yes stop_codon:yes gene_type:complete
MYSKSSVKNSYYGLKEVFREIKEQNYKKKYKETERFEDVPKEISDKDKDGKIQKISYMDFYLSMKSNRQIKDNEVQPSGVTATNKNYDYANAKFVESLE